MYTFVEYEINGRIKELEYEGHFKYSSLLV